MAAVRHEHCFLYNLDPEATAAVTQQSQPTKTKHAFQLNKKITSCSLPLDPSLRRRLGLGLPRWPRWQRNRSAAQVRRAAPVVALLPLPRLSRLRRAAGRRGEGARRRGATCGATWCGAESIPGIPSAKKLNTTELKVL